jgi:hypothetical protein
MPQKDPRSRTRMEMVEGYIHPCGGRVALQDCFTREGDTILFRFNISDGSTRLVSFLFPVPVMRTLFRGKFLDYFRKAPPSSTLCAQYTGL